MQVHINSVVLGFGGVRRATLLVDGVEAGSGDWSISTGGCAVNCSITALIRDVKSGTYSIAFRIDDQSRSDITYQSVGVVNVFSPNGGNEGAVKLEAKVRMLSEGQRILYTISI